MIFPPEGDAGRTRMVLSLDPDRARLPAVHWLGVGECVAEAATRRPGEALLLEHSANYFGRPGLRGYRLAVGSGADQDPASRDVAGQDWSTAFRPTAVHADDRLLTIEAEDASAGLALRTEVEALTGGALRVRHILTNTGRTPYLVEGLEVSVPLSDSCVELLDFTGRHMGERNPQRHPIADGLWLRESRGGRPGFDWATVLIAGSAGLGFAAGEAVAVSVACSGNSVLLAQRSAAGPAASPATMGGGELLLPGEVVLGADESYVGPWVFVVAADDGLDGIAARLHAWQRSLSSHPAPQPVVFNTWEAVYFDHDLAALLPLVERAARVGVERFVLDDGWFRGRRDPTAGLGDWVVDEAVWPDGLTPLIAAVRAAGMDFGIWVEPEMVNPDSDLYRAHPDWVLSARGRLPLLHRDQLVLDLTNPGAWQHVHDQLDTLLTENEIGFVKWDHNRELLEAGSSLRHGAPSAHRQNAAFGRLLDSLRERHPSVAFESCASGGARMDLSVIERVQRVWTSDQTDALARQRIQRWSAQLIAPEYLAAHVASPTSHHSGRTFSLDFRAGTALFGSFGIEWDLGQANESELSRLAEWVATYKRWRPLLGSGRMIRLDVTDPAVLAHGVVATDRSRALLAHVQLDESQHNRGAVLRIPGLEPSASYRCRWLMPSTPSSLAPVGLLDPVGPVGDLPTTGAELARVGLWVPRRQPETVTLIAVEEEAG